MGEETLKREAIKELVKLLSKRLDEAKKGPEHKNYLGVLG